MSDPLGKPRGDSVLKTLPEDTQSQIIDLLKAKGASYRKVRAQLAAEWDIDTNETSLRDFYSWWHMRQRFASAAARGKQLQEMLASSDPSMSPEKIEAAGQAVFLNEAIETGDTKAFVSVSRLRLAKQAFEAEKSAFRLKYQQKDREIEQRERQIILEREKFETDAAKKAMAFVAEIKTIAANKSLDSDARIEQVRLRLFGAAPTMEESAE